MGLSPLKRRHFLGYGIGDLGFALIIHMHSMWALYFFTDIFGISAAVVGLIFAGTKIWDAINDPILGFISDRTQTRWGKYRPYLIFGGVPLVICQVLFFTVPDLGPNGKIVWAVVVISLHGMAYTATNLPYGSLAAVYTQNPNERTSLAAARIYLGTPGVIILAFSKDIIVNMCGGDERVGFMITALVFGSMAAIFFWITSAVVKERVKPERENYSLKEMMAMIFQNKPLLLICAAIFVLGMGNAVRTAMAVYYFKYNLGMPEMYKILMLVLIFGIVIGSVLTEFLNKRMIKRNIYFVGLAVMVVGDFCTYFCPYYAVNWILFFSFLSGIGTGIYVVLIWSIIADTVEYGEWKTGKRAEGITYASHTFIGKLSGALATAASGFALSLAGYVPNVTQTATTDWVIRAGFTLGPVLLITPVVAIMWFYRLDGEMFQRILADLEKRRLAKKTSG
ncbi:MAG: MFS transporter [Proteobacteria bacterium]|nr:MFS transporter [Pseudomonadota bacterium]